MKKFRPVFIILVFSLLMFQSCNDTEESETINQNKENILVSKWFLLQTQLIKTTPNTPPPVAARYLAYSSITLYQSLHKAMGVSSLQDKINGMSNLPSSNSKEIVWSIVANSAMSQITALLFENTTDSNKEAIANLETEMLQFYKSKNSITMQTSVEESVALGKKIAEAVYEFSKTDGGHQAYANLYSNNYVVPTGLGAWQPQPNASNTKPLLPFWGNNRTLLKATKIDVFKYDKHPEFSTDPNSEFYKKAVEVYQVSKQLTQEQTTIANFWSDGGNTVTPPGHMIAITVQLIQDKNLDLYEAARLITQVGIGLYDASVVCWRMKYETNLLRPASYIKNYIDPNWSSLIATPPFPSYSSGHATFSGTTAAILGHDFGNNYSFTDKTKVSAGFEPRTFKNFKEMADEAANSRLYGGIHYTFDNAEGLLCGNFIAQEIFKLNL
jgi:membrane-associated phospholipid phosphatase